MAAYQAPPSLGFSRQKNWSGLLFPSPMHESEEWQWSCSVVSNPQRHHELQPSRLLCPRNFPGKSTGVGCHCRDSFYHPELPEAPPSFRTVYLLSCFHLKLCVSLYQDQFSSVAQSCLTLCDPIDSSPPGSPVRGVLQARTLDWVPSPMHQMSGADYQIKYTADFFKPKEN